MGSFCVFYIVWVLMVYSYYGKDRIKSVSLRHNIMFAREKIRGLYPLHIATMFAALVFLFVGGKTDSLVQIVFKVCLNIFLVQQWLPIKDPSINIVSWYLCTAVFTYFLFPWILRYMERDYDRKKAKRTLILLFLFQTLAGIIGLYLSKAVDDSMDGVGWMNPNIVEWFVYHFPFVRMLDFAIGCQVGYLFLDSDMDSGNRYGTEYTGLELLTMLLIVVANVCCIILSPKALPGLDAVPNPACWWTYAIVFTIPSCMLVYLAAKNKGGLSSLLTNRFMVYLGNISMYTYLIHKVIFQYIEAACIIFAGRSFCYSGWIKLTVGFALTLVATKVWMQIIHKEVKY